MKERITPAIAFAKQGQWAQIIALVGDINKANGYWEKSDKNPRTREQLQVLIITELAECIEAYRKERFAEVKWFEVEKSVINDNFKRAYENCIKDTYEAELAGTVIRCLDYFAQFGGEPYVKHSDNGFDSFWDFIRLAMLKSLMGYPENTIDYILNVCEGCKEGVYIRTEIDIWHFVSLELEYNIVRGTKAQQGKVA